MSTQATSSSFVLALQTSCQIAGSSDLNCEVGNSFGSTINNMKQPHAWIGFMRLRLCPNYIIFPSQGERTDGPEAAIAQYLCQCRRAKSGVSMLLSFKVRAICIHLTYGDLKSDNRSMRFFARLFMYLLGKRKPFFLAGAAAAAANTYS